MVLRWQTILPRLFVLCLTATNKICTAGITVCNLWNTQCTVNRRSGRTSDRMEMERCRIDSEKNRASVTFGTPETAALRSFHPFACGHSVHNFMIFNNIAPHYSSPSVINKLSASLFQKQQECVCFQEWDSDTVKIHPLGRTVYFSTELGFI